MPDSHVASLPHDDAAERAFLADDPDPTPPAPETDVAELEPYRRAGMRFIKMRVRGKKPAEAFKDKDPHPWEQVREHVAAGANVGVHLGGWFPLDVDPRHGGRESYRRLLDDLAARGAELPDMPCVLTGGGGYHLFLRLPPGYDIGPLSRNPGRYPGLDFKGAAPNQYVICAGSVHDSGRPYEWMPFGRIAEDGTETPPLDLIDAPEAPAALLGLLAEERAAKAQPSAAPRTDGAGEEIPEGERDNELTRIAGSLRRAGMDADAIGRKLLTINAERCTPPLPDADVWRIARSVGQYEAGPPDETQLGNCERFLRDHGSEVMHCEILSEATWFGWDGVRWNKGKRAGVRERAKETVRGIQYEAATAPDENRRKALWKWAKVSQSGAQVREMLNLAASAVEVHPSDLNADRHLLTCANGTLELHADGRATLREHRPEDRITLTTGIDYRAGARCEAWEGTLRLALPDPEERAFLQRAAGATLHGGNGGREKFVLCVFGPPNTLKTAVVKRLCEALGEYGRTTRLSTFGVDTDKGGNTPSLARMADARMVMIPEIPPKRPALATGLMKQWSGGEHVEVMNKFEDAVEIRPAAKIWMYGNDAPRVPYDDEAAWNRIHVIPFRHPQPTCDAPEIDLRAVLAWMVEGWRQYCAAGGLQPPAGVRDAVEAYRDEEDPIGGFVEERLRLEPGGFATNAELEEAYASWCREHGVRRPLGPRNLRKVLTARDGVEIGQANDRRRTRGVAGVRVRPAAGDFDPEDDDPLFG